MKHTVIILSIFAVLFPLIASGQDNSLKIIEPTHLSTPPTLNESRLNKELQEAQYIRDTEGEEHLSEKQKNITDWADNWWYADTNDLWYVGQIGDGWYNCGWPDSIFATSSLQPLNEIDYKAENAHDWSLRTAWIEGVKGDGIGESITYRFSEGTPPITTVDVYNGYAKSEKTWRDNSRVKQLKLYINGQPYALLNLKDTYQLQTFDIGEHPGSGTFLKFEITDVYKGDKYDDTAISEINFYGTGCLCFAEGTMISTPEGEKPIEQLRVGDKVLSLNEQTNEPEEATVLELANREHYLYVLDFGSVKIKTTADHPFYFEGNYYSIERNSTYGIETKSLIVGQSVNYLNKGRLEAVVLEKIDKLDSRETTYTITKLDKNKLFFANGLCVSTEKTSGSRQGQR